MVKHENDDDNFNISVDILTEALQKMGERGITRQEVLPYLVDFAASVAIALGGEDAVRACIIRLGDRIKDYREGNFPVKRDSES